MVTPMGLWASAAGLVLSLEDDDERLSPLLAVAVLVIPVLMVAPLVTRNLSSLYTARRFVPVALPLIAVFAAYAAVRASAAIECAATLEAPQRRLPTWLWKAALAAGALLVLAGLTSASAPLLGARDFSGGEVLARRLAEHGEPSDVLLFASTLDGNNAGRLAAPTWTLTGKPTAVLASPDLEPSAISGTIGAWRSEGREVYFVSDDRDSLPAIPGYTLVEIGEEALVSYVIAPDPALPPRWTHKELLMRVFEIRPAPEHNNALDAPAL
jgi:hypothetical protein